MESEGRPGNVLGRSVPVSVVMPAYNAGAYMELAVSSIREQTVQPAEMIVVDDGSEVPVESALGDMPDWLRVITLDRNRGPGFARNIGVKEATQPLVAFLDADDVWLPRKLEVQYDLMRAWPELDASHTDAIYFFKDGKEVQREPQPRALTVSTALSNHVMCTPSMMIKKTSLDQLSGFDARFRCTQDWEMQIRMALAGMKAQFIPEILVRVRREDHGHHSANWRCYLAGHLGILRKHRKSYLGLVGYRGFVRKFTYELYRGGYKAGGLLGSLFKLPYRLGI